MLNQLQFWAEWISHSLERSPGCTNTQKRKHDRPKKLPTDCASTYRQQGSWTHRSWQTLPILTALATWQAIWFQEGWRNIPSSATETLPRLEQTDWQLMLRWSSLFWPEKGVRSGLAWWPLGQGGSSWYSRLSIGLDQEFFFRYVAKLPWLKASPHHLWKSEQVFHKGPSLAHSYFQYTSMILCLPPPCTTLISSPTTSLRMFHPRAYSLKHEPTICSRILVGLVWLLAPLNPPIENILHGVAFKRHASRPAVHLHQW